MFDAHAGKIFQGVPAAMQPAMASFEALDQAAQHQNVPLPTELFRHLPAELLGDIKERVGRGRQGMAQIRFNPDDEGYAGI